MCNSRSRQLASANRYAALDDDDDDHQARSTINKNNNNNEYDAQRICIFAFVQSVNFVCSLSIHTQYANALMLMLFSRFVCINFLNTNRATTNIIIWYVIEVMLTLAGRGLSPFDV